MKAVDVHSEHQGGDGHSHRSAYTLRAFILTLMITAAVAAIAFGEEVADWVFSHFSGLLD
jgi:hypothetical protein